MTEIALGSGNPWGTRTAHFIHHKKSVNGMPFCKGHAGFFLPNARIGML
jgi:hypothetical protein